MQAIYFSGGNLLNKLTPGDRLDVAFTPQINEFRGLRTVQLNLADLRRVSPSDYYDRFRRHEALLPCEAAALAPERTDVADVWNYLRSACAEGTPVKSELTAFCAAVAVYSHERHSIRRTLACLAILSELHFLEVARHGSVLEIRLLPVSGKNPLENSAVYRDLRSAGGK